MSRSHASHTEGIGEVVRDFIATRPRRPRHGRKVAGVASGIANRYAIDPVIVRVAFVVTALFGGAGVLAYLIGWLVLPEESDEVSPIEAMLGRGRSATSTAFTLLLCLAIIPASSWFFGATWFAGGGFSGFLGAAALLGGLYLLHQNRGHLVRPEPTSVSTGGSMYTSSTDVPGSAQPTGPAPSEVPGWDPLGAAPLAWDLPEPRPSMPESPTPRPRRPKVGLITMGLALVVGAVGFWIAAMDGVQGVEPAFVIGLVLGVIGLGMVAGSFVRSGRGLIWPAVGLSAIGLLVAGQGGYAGWHGTGDLSFRPAGVADVRPSYQVTAGSLDLDLTALPDSGTVRTTVRNTFGDVRVLVPQNADVQANCSAKVGSVECLQETRDGVGSTMTATDYGEDGPGGLRIDLDAITSAGTVEVLRD